MPTNSLRPAQYLMVPLLFLAACGGDESSGPSCSDRTTLTTDTDTASVYERKVRPIVITYLDCNGDPASGTLTYSSLDSSVAVLTATGITGVNAGQVQVRVSDGTRTASIAVTVKHLPQVLDTIPVSGTPFGIVATTTRVLTTRLNASAIADATIPVTSFNVTGFVTGQYPTDVAVAGTGPKAYVTNQAPHTVGVLDMTSRTEVDSIPVQGSPFRVIFNALGTRAYVTVADFTDGRVYAIDATTDSVLDSIAVGSGPNGIVLSADEQTLFVSHMSGSVHVIDAGTLAPIDTLPIAGQLQDIALSENGNTLYLASEFVGLLVYDMVTRSVATTIPLANAFGLKLHPAGDLVMVAGGQTITIIERSTLNIVDTITGSGYFRRIAFTPIGTAGFVTNEGTSRVIVLE